MSIKNTNLDLYIQIIELSDTICQAVNYIAAESQHGNPCEELKEDLPAGMRQLLHILADQFPTKKLEELIIKSDQLLTTLFQGEQTDSANEPEDLLAQRLQGFHHTFNQLIIQGLINALVSMETSSLDGETARFLFEYFSDPILGSEISGTGWFIVARLSAVSLPKESYEHTVKAFDIYEDLHLRLTAAGGVTREKYQPVAENFFEACPICGGTGDPHFNAIQICNPMWSPAYPAAKLWMKCRRCENLWAYNFPQQTLVSDQTLVSAYKTKLSEGIPAPHTLHFFSEILNRIAAHTSGKTMLEIGIGNGEMIATAIEFGYAVDAVEISPTACEAVSRALNVDIACVDFLRFETDKKYDILSMGDVIEHVDDPIYALKKAHGLLKPGGVLWLSTPNYESGYSQFMRFRDPMWHAPYHFTYFNRKSLLNILHELGFEYKRYDVCQRYNGSMELILVKK